MSGEESLPIGKKWKKSFHLKCIIKYIEHMITYNKNVSDIVGTTIAKSIFHLEIML